MFVLKGRLNLSEKTRRLNISMLLLLPTLKPQGHDFWQINLIKVAYHILTTKTTILLRKKEWNFILTNNLMIELKITCGRV